MINMMISLVGLCGYYSGQHFSETIYSISQFLAIPNSKLVVKNSLDVNRHAMMSLLRSSSAPVPLEFSDPLRPALWSYRLCIKKAGGTTWLIQTPKDLQGLVSINSPEDAIKYLREFSRVNTIRLYSQYHFVEVLEKNEATSIIDVDFAYANLAELADTMGVAAPTPASESDNMYLISRCLLEYDGERAPSIVHFVAEKLSKDGHYEVVFVRSRPYDELCDKLELPKRRLPY